MTTKTLNTAAFITQLLAPIPAGDEQIRSPEFVRQLRQDWRRGMDDVEYAEHGHYYEAIGCRLGIVGHSERVHQTMFCNMLAAHAEQCLIPAPTTKELRWKKRRLHSVLAREDVKAAIARDEVALAA